MRIGLLGDPEDLAAVYVSWLARRQGVEVLDLPEAHLGTKWTFTFDDPSGDPCLEIDSERCPSAALDGVFVRLNPAPPLPDGLALDAAHRYAFVLERREALHHFLDALPCRVVNRPTGGRSNGSKPYQMRRLAAAGFRVPRWIATNAISAAQRFLADCPRGAIVKASSGLRAQVRRVDDDLLERLLAGTAPVVLQEYVPGRDVRVHTVGSRSFATEVVSAGIDYRFESEGARYCATVVPLALEQLCYRVASCEGLELAGFDFRVTAEEEWYCLEVNPVPSFLPYELTSGLPIGSAVVDALCGR